MSLSLGVQLIGVSFACGLLAGWVMHRSDFCLAGMFRDLFLFGETLRLRALLLAIVAAMVGIEVLRLLGLFARYPFPVFGPPSLVNVVGGLLFGIGMVLAGGCVVGTLYRLGAGSLPALLAFAGLLAGSALYAEIHPWWSAMAKAGTLPLPATVPAALGLPPTPVLAVCVALAGALLWRWFRQGRMSVPTAVAGYLQPWRAALLLALTVVVSCLLIGLPLGITTTYAKLGGAVEQLLWPEHVADLAFFGVVSLDYVPPFASETVRGGPAPRWDGIAAIQLPLIVGIVLGSAVSALRLGEWHLHRNLPWRQVLSALAGGVIMGLAARMAPACNVQHLLGGLPILAGQSLLFLLGLLPGAWLGGILLSRWVLPAGRS